MRTSTYSVIIHPNEAGEESGYWVEVPVLPGCFSRGRTTEEAITNAHEAIQLHLRSMLKHGETVPVESSLPSVVIIQIPLPQPA
ncbi:MAG: type II toxin-antitoxin system HicB family antitoxin [Candidatus Vogelbacteria bacterium]|nr:type II toxin-antitoxin system HicB family antitoxin [Candidatus Vogelbacteria bacterium]